MNITKNIFITFFILFSMQINLNAELPHYVDFQKILNESTAGKKAQIELKSRLQQNIKQLNTRQKSLQEEEKKIIQQKKVLSVDDYKKKVAILRKKVTSLQKDRSESLQKIANQRAKAKTQILKTLNPIIKDYMKKENIRMVINNKNLILADEKLNITQNVMSLLNDKIKSIKLD